MRTTTSTAAPATRTTGLLPLAALLSSLALAGCSTTGTGLDDAAPASATEGATGAPASSPSGGPATTSPSAVSTGSVEAPPLDEDCGPYDDPEVLARVADASLLDALREDPRLEGFVAALTGEVDPAVDLSGALAGGPFTVLAPVDATFEEEESARNSFFLSYHLVPGEGLSPEELVEEGSTGSGLETLQGWELPVFGEATAPTVSEDSVAVLCGGVRTAGGTVYVIEQQVHPAGDYAVPGSTEPAVPTTGAPSR